MSVAAPELNSVHDQACSHLLSADVSLDDMIHATENAISANVDCADLYVQKSVGESWQLDESRIDSGRFDSVQGMAMRAVCGEASVFACADLITAATLGRLGEVVRNGPPFMAGETRRVELSTNESSPKARYGSHNPLDFDDVKRIAMLRHVNEYARSRDDKILNVIAGLSMAQKTVLIVRSDGQHICDIRPIVGVNVTVIMQEGDKIETGGHAMGSRKSLETLENADLERLVDEAIRQARLKLTAAPAPAGSMPVVLGNGWAGILLHEAVGHGLEGDFNRKGQSAFSGRVGERVAPKGVTVVDDGTLPDRRGSLTCDDEGNPSGRNVLIEDGILRGYMQDMINSALMGVSATGNGRRESYRHEPMPRMTNTYMLNGEHDPEEIISSVKKGLYCKSFAGGSVDITNGNFNFDTTEAYLIEDGKVGRNVKGATIIGNGPESMTKMSLVGNDLQLDPGIGTCGKNGQWVPVGVGQPHCKVDEMLVGGTEG